MNTKRTFSFKDAFTFATTAYIHNFITFLIMLAMWVGIEIIILALSGAIGFGVGALTQFVSWKMPFIIGLSVGGILSYIVATYYQYQITRAGFALYDNKNIHWRDFFESEQFTTYLFAMIWFHLKVILGLIVLIIPGIYLFIKYWFTGYSLIEHKTHTVKDDALNAELASQNARWSICYFAGITSLIYSITRLGAFFLMPIGSMAAIHAYKQLSSSSPIDIETKEGTV